MKYIMQNFLLISLIFSSFIFAQEENKSISIFSAINNKNVTVGDKITLAVKIFIKENSIKNILLPEKVEAENFELKNFKVYKDTKLEDNRILKRIDYIFSIYKTGEFKIPSFKIEYKDKNEKSQFLNTEEFSITVSSIIKDDINKIKDVKDIKDIVEIKADYLVWIFSILGILVLIISFFFLIDYFKNKKGKFLIKPKKIKFEEEIAFENLEELKRKNLLEKGLVKAFFFELSNIIKCYLEKRYDINAVDYTSSEIVYALKKNNMGMSDFHLIKDFLQDSDLVKFAKWIPDNEFCIQCFDKAKKIVGYTMKKRDNIKV